MTTKPLLLFLIAGACVAAPPNLKPLMAVPGELVWQSDFEEAQPLKRAEWTPRQGTRWTIENGILRGQQSPPEFQARKKDHKGLEPRISAPVTPAQCVIQFSVRFLDGAENKIVPFVEIGHHIARLRFSTANGLEVLADYETTRVAHAPEFKFELGTWYHCLAELQGDEFVVQIAGGPTLHARHECFSKPAPSGGTGFGLAGPRKGIAELDNVTFWQAGRGNQPGWTERRAKFPEFEPVKVKEKPAPKEKPAKKAK